MSAVQSGRRSLQGLTLEAVMRAEKRTPPRPLPVASPPRNHSNRTLLDIIRDEHKLGHNRDKMTWRNFRDKLRLKRPGAVWTSSVTIPSSDIPIQNSDIPVPASDIPVQNSNSQQFNRLGHLLLLSNTTEITTEATQSELIHSDNSADFSIPDSGPPARSLRTRISRQNPQPTRVEDDDEPVAREGRIRLGVALAVERALSAREAEAATIAEPPPREEPQPERMSLMDLLEETDRQMGLVGVRYAIGSDLDGNDAEEEKGEDDDSAAQDSGGGSEFSCCVCMIRSKGAAFIPCGHTFCRLCSRELWLQRGNCPLCNSFILEILDIF